MKLATSRMELSKVRAPNIRAARIAGASIGIPEVKLPDIELPTLDTDAIGRSIAERLPTRRSRSRLPLVVALLGLVAMGWLLVARAAAPLRGSFGSIVQTARQRLPEIASQARRRAAQLSDRGADVADLSGDVMEPTTEELARADQP